MVTHAIQSLLGVKSLPKPHGREVQGGHCTEVGRAKLASAVLNESREEIVEAYKEAWDAFPMEKYKNMVNRLPKVMQQTIKEKGGNRHT